MQAYPLMHPYGEGGWHVGLTQSRGNRRVSMNQFYRFLFHFRDTGELRRDVVLCNRRLSLAYLVDAWVNIEENTLAFMATTAAQRMFRAESYQGVHDAIASGRSVDGGEIGRRVVLPASFAGGPRYYRGLYLDAMQVVKTFGKPDYFITVSQAWHASDCKRHAHRYDRRSFAVHGESQLARSLAGAPSRAICT